MLTAKRNWTSIFEMSVESFIMNSVCTCKQMALPSFSSLSSSLSPNPDPKAVSCSKTWV